MADPRVLDDIEAKYRETQFLVESAGFHSIYEAARWAAENKLSRTIPVRMTNEKSMKTRSERKIDSLLDAAFAMLQHDTGPHDAEYRFQRAELGKEFKKILKSTKGRDEK